MTTPSNNCPAIVTGIRPWKRWQVDSFLLGRYGRLHYAHSPQAALRAQSRQGGDIIVWAAREPDGFAAAVAAQGARLVRIEDGFLRSVGLGSQHIGGASLVIDADGIYFDPRSPSALETLLQSAEFEAATLARAKALRERIVQAGVSKYNVGRREPAALGGAGQRRVLVPGQVEDDASIRFGAPGVRTNLDLLRVARAAEPAAWIVYKPHPDTEAGARRGALADAQALRYANEVVRGVSASALLSQVEAVHTMTSLLGFEALLRDVAVTCWGQPFYSGWGLTEDKLPLARRTRRRSLDELVAAALILYPAYVHPQTRAPCEVEGVVEWLAARAGEDAEAAPNPLRRALQLCQGLYRSWQSAHEQA